MEGANHKMIRRAEEKAASITQKAEERCRHILSQAECDAEREVQAYEERLRGHYAAKKYDLSKEVAELESSKKQENDAATASYARNEKRTVDYLLRQITEVKVAFPRNVISQFKEGCPADSA